MNKLSAQQGYVAGIMLVLLTTLATWSVLAQGKEEKILTEQFSITQFKQLVINANVGSVSVSASKDNKVHVLVKVSARDNWGWFNSTVEDAKLAVKRQGDQLKIAVNDDDYGEEWQIKLPASLDLKLDLGVGSAVIKDIIANIDINIGVGEVRIVTDSKAFKQVAVESGVGDATISANTPVKRKRAMVSVDSHWQGHGEFTINAEVGVGDARVILN
ncbi:MAG: hypothetical protein HRU24_02705 [Gammaproteobacteria bacterium]|nr:hypothetical protein [Gammaproteobacteria bacterium]